MQQDRSRRRVQTGIESLEQRRLLAFVATMLGSQVTFFDSGASLLNVRREANGKLSHNRFTQGDSGYASDYDFDSLLPGVQPLAAGPAIVIRIFASAGTAKLRIDDSERTAGGAYTVTHDASTLPDGTRFQYDDDIIHLTLRTSEKSDDVDVRSTRADWFEGFRLHTNGGHDRIDYGASGSMDDLQAYCTISTGAGDDTIHFHDELDASAGNVYSFSSQSMSRSGIPQFAYEDVEGLHIDTTQQADTVSFKAGSSTRSIAINTSGGADSLDIDSVNLVNYTNFTVNTGGGNDTVDVNKTGLDHAVKLTAGAGNDTLRLNAQQGQPCQVSLSASETLASLTVAHAAQLTLPSSSSAYLVVNSMPTMNGRIDLLDAAMIIRGPVAMNAIRTALDKGYADGGWNGSGGGGTYSSAAALSGALDGVGYCTAAQARVTTFAGVAVSPGDAILERTLMGDTNLDHQVDFADLLKLAQNYGKNDMHWNAGNFDFDPVNKVDFSDLLIFAQNYGSSLLAAPAGGLEPRHLRVLAWNTFSSSSFEISLWLK